MGKDHIDFDLNIQSVDEANHTAVVVVHHVTPTPPTIEIPLHLMKNTPV
jgi:hypothetical protein